MNVNRGYFGIGVFKSKSHINIGTLWRSANIFGADFIFTVGQRYSKQHSDTYKTPRHVPLFFFKDIDDLIDHLPDSCPLVGVEMDDRAKNLWTYRHKERACYILGAEDHGLNEDVLNRCHYLIKLPGERSLNVATAGSIVMYHRYEQCREK